MKSQNKIFTINIISTILLKGISFFTAPIFARMLGTDSYGTVTLFTTWGSLAATLFTLQAGAALANARVAFPDDDQTEYQSSVLTLAHLSYLCFSIITLVIMFILRSKLEVNFPIVICILVSGIGSYSIQFYNSKFTYEFKAGKNFFLSMGVVLTSVILSLILIPAFPQEVNYWGRVIALTLTDGLFGLVIFSHCILKGKKLYNNEYWKFTVPIAIPTIFHLLCSLVLTQSDRLMIDWMIDTSSVGIYSLAVTFASIMTIVWNSFNSSWVPYYYEYTKQSKIDEMLKHAQNYYILFTGVSCGFVLLSPDVYRIFADREYWYGSNAVILLTIGCFFSFLYSFPANYLFYHKKTSKIAVGSAIAAGLNIILNYVLINIMGIYGAVVATITCNFMQFLIQHYNAKKYKEQQYPFKLGFLTSGIIPIFLATALSLFPEETMIIRWLISLLIGVYLICSIYKRRAIF